MLFVRLVRLTAPQRGPAVVAQLLVHLGEIGGIPMHAIPDLLHSIQTREQLGTTGIGRGLAIPHARHPDITTPIGMIGVCEQAVDFNSIDGEPVDCFFLLLGLNHVTYRFHEVARFFPLLRQGELATDLRTLREPSEIQQWLRDLNRQIGGQEGPGDEPGIVPEPAPVTIAVTLRGARRFAIACDRFQNSDPNPEPFLLVSASERMLESHKSEVIIPRALENLEREYHHHTRGRNLSVACLNLALVHPNPYRVLHLALVAAWQRQLPRDKTAAWMADFFGPVGHPIDPVWLVAQDQAVVRVARGIHESGDYTETPILADALEDAGCADPAILNHLRGPGPHDRGCWVIDRILGIE